jgi:hypothetical protein
MRRGFICPKCGARAESELLAVKCEKCGASMRRDWKEIHFAPSLPPMKGYHPQLGEEAAAKYSSWEDQRKYCEEKLQKMYDAPIKIENLRE